MCLFPGPRRIVSSCLWRRTERLGVPFSGISPSKLCCVAKQYFICVGFGLLGVVVVVVSGESGEMEAPVYVCDCEIE